MRLTEINNYYIDQYTDHAKILKYAICALIPLIILLVLKRMQLLPNSVFTLLFVLCASIGGIVVIPMLFYSFYRDKMNYNQFDWESGAPTGIPVNTTNPNGVNNPTTKSMSQSCTNQDCCPSGYTYSAVDNKCTK